MWSRTSLTAKMFVLVALGLGVVFAAFGTLSSWALGQTTTRSLEERLLLARVAAGSIDHYNRDVLWQVEQAGAGLAQPGGLAANRAALKSAQANLGAIGQRLLLMDTTGKVLLSEPPDAAVGMARLSDHLDIERVIGGTPAISNVMESAQGGSPSVVYAAPVRNGTGAAVGILGAVMDSNSNIDGFIQAIKLGRTGYAQVVDGQGMLLASTSPEAIFGKDDHGDRFITLIEDKKAVVRSCHNCHLDEGGAQRRRDVLAFAPLETASWGVAVRQSEQEALTPTTSLRQGMWIVGGLSLGLALVSTVLLGSSIVRPIRSLTAGARRIASGDLDGPIQATGHDEVGVLAQNFEAMRLKLKQSRQEIDAHTETIERRTQERQELLKRIISVQEEERKRLARELHDETAQMLSALIMRLEAAESRLPHDLDTVRKELADSKGLANRGLGDIRKLMLSLRPAALDDLGLVSALRWYAENYLENKGIKVSIEAGSLGGQRLRPELETTLFRVAQEAINNIARHSAATAVCIRLEATDSRARVEIQDNGRGFDTEQLNLPGMLPSGLGLMGMQERITLLGGNLQVKSQPGKGTRILAEVPLISTEA